MSINELIDNLSRQINPNVQDPVLFNILLERVLQIVLNSCDHVFRPLEIVNVPLIVSASFLVLT